MEREVEILNELGLHARPAAEFVRCVRRFESVVFIVRDGQRFSAGSIIDLLTANLDCGARVQLEAIGPDAEATLDRLCGLLVELRDEEKSNRLR